MESEFRQRSGDEPSVGNISNSSCDKNSEDDVSFYADQSNQIGYNFVSPDVFEEEEEEEEEVREWSPSKNLQVTGRLLPSPEIFQSESPSSKRSELTPPRNLLTTRRLLSSPDLFRSESLSSKRSELTPPKNFQSTRQLLSSPDLFQSEKSSLHPPQPQLVGITKRLIGSQDNAFSSIDVNVDQYMSSRSIFSNETVESFQEPNTCLPSPNIFENELFADDTQEDETIANRHENDTIEIEQEIIAIDSNEMGSFSDNMHESDSNELGRRNSTANSSPEIIFLEMAAADVETNVTTSNSNIIEIVDDLNENNLNDLDAERTLCPIEVLPRIIISPESQSILNRIEAVVLEMINNLKSGQNMQISVQNRTDWSNCVFEDEIFNLRPLSNARLRRIRSTSVLSVIFYLLGEIYEMILLNKKCTIREFYYRDVTITRRQENVNDAMKIICCLLDAKPWQLGVMSTSKGLISGSVKILLLDNIIIDCGLHREGMILPQFTIDIQRIDTNATFVLLVEKDTIFKKLAQCNILNRLGQECILITGKGYPDTNTRLILKKIYEMHLLPIYAVTDADPYGIEIMLTYRHGSLTMSNLSDTLAVPSIRWMGIFPSDIEKFGIKSIPLTNEDKRKLKNIMDRPYVSNEVYRELQVMQRTNLKAEIEGIAAASCSYLIDVYLRNKFDNKLAI